MPHCTVSEDIPCSYGGCENQRVSWGAEHLLDYGVLFSSHTDPEYQIHYCPHWFLKSEQFLEVLAQYNHYQSHNLSAYWVGGTIPIAVDRAMRAFAHGYGLGLKGRPKPKKDPNVS